MAKSIIFYYEWLSLINSLNNEDRLKLYDAIFSVDRYLDINCNQHLWGVYNFIISKINDNEDKYQKIVDRNRSNGLKGGRKPSGFSGNPDEPKENDWVKLGCLNDNDNVNDNVNKNKNNNTYSAKTKVFTPPLSDEVINYFIEQGSDREHGEQFYDHFTSNGWLVGGKAKMKDWRASARNWIRNIPNFLPKEQREEEARKKFIASL